MELKQILLQYGTLTEECISEFQKRARIIHAGPSDIIVKQGEKCKKIYLNRSGIMRVCYSSGQDEDEETVLFGSEGDIYTSLHSLYANMPAVFSLVSVYDSEIYEISYRDLWDTVEQYPEMLKWLLRLSLGQLYALELRYIQHSKKTGEERLRTFIERDEPDVLNQKVRTRNIIQTIPQKYLASYLRIKPETLSRLRRNILKPKK